MSSEPLPDAQRDLRIEMLDALLLALERRRDIAELIADSADADEARRRVEEALGVSEQCAVEVLNMQWRRWTLASREDLRARRDEYIARRHE